MTLTPRKRLIPEHSQSPRGWRIAKEKACRKIDAIVALAMGCVAALERRPESRIRVIGERREEPTAERLQRMGVRRFFDLLDDPSPWGE